MRATMKTADDGARGIDFEKGATSPPGDCVRVCTGMRACGWLLPAPHGSPQLKYYILYAPAFRRRCAIFSSLLYNNIFKKKKDLRVTPYTGYCFVAGTIIVVAKGLNKTKGDDTIYRIKIIPVDISFFFFQEI